MQQPNCSRRRVGLAFSRTLLLASACAPLGCQAAPNTVHAGGSSQPLVTTDVADPGSPLLEAWVPDGGWLAADYWMGALPSQMTQADDGALLVSTEIQPGHSLRVER